MYSAIQLTTHVVLSSPIVIVFRAGWNYFRPMRRVVWGTFHAQRRFNASKEVYRRVPDALRDEFNDIEDWLAEEAKTSQWHEIYLLHPIIGNPKGVLSASFYPHYESETFKGRPMCVINTIVAKKGLGLDEALHVETKLWNSLCKVVRDITKGPWEDCHFFIESLCSDPTMRDTSHLVDSDEAQRRREFAAILKEMKAERIPRRYRIPDMRTYREDEEVEADLYHLGPTIPLDRGEILNFVYGFHYFWTFSFGRELTDVKDLSRRLGYVKDLIARVGLDTPIEKRRASVDV